MDNTELRSLMEAYNEVYSDIHYLNEDDCILEEVIDELIEEYVEEGFSIEDVIDIIEEATLLYIDEATITYGSDTETPEQKRSRAKTILKQKKAKVRKAAVTGAVRGAKAAAGIAGSIAKDEARRAGRVAKHRAEKTASAVGGAVTGAINRAKEKVGGAKAAAGIAGSIAKDEARRAGRVAKHRAEKTASAIKGAVSSVRSAASEKKEKIKSGIKSGVKKILGKGLRAASGASGVVAQKVRKVGSAASKAAERLGEDLDIFDVILEFLQNEGIAEDLNEATWIMSNVLTEEQIDEILGLFKKKSTVNKGNATEFAGRSMTSTPKKKPYEVISGKYASPMHTVHSYGPKGEYSKKRSAKV